MIAPAWQKDLYKYIAGTIRGLDGEPLRIGGVADHVHILVGLKASHCLADFMREMKKASSSWAADPSRDARFRWQEGYAAFSVSASVRPTVENYIDDQEEHHRVRTFREELIEFLQRSGVPYDERYLD